MGVRLRLTVAMAAVLALAAPATAAAADQYADDDAAGNTPPCTQVAPCTSIETAAGAASPGDTVFIDGGTYPGLVILGGGVTNRDLLGGEFVAPSDGPAIVSNPASTGISVLGAGNDISGLTFDALLGVGSAVPVSIHGNVFRLATSGDPTGVILQGGSTGSTVAGNDFRGTTPIAPSNGSRGLVANAGPVTITGNTFENTNQGIFVNASGLTISGNEFSGLYTTLSGNAGAAVDMATGATTLTGNVVNPPDPIRGGIGFRTSNNGTTATVSRNELHGQIVGLQAENSTISADSNLIVDTPIAGFAALAFDSVDPGAATLNLTNLTADGGIQIQGPGHVDLDSSIVAAPFDLSIGPGGGTCTITFSRGPTTGAGCSGFQTTADPGYVNAAGGNYRLLSSSPLLDAGNTAAPPLGALDLDGGPRAVLKTSTTCPPTAGRRDMGAYEFASTTVCPTPVTPKGTPVPPTKRCKKKKSKKRAAGAAKKKCKKKKKKKR